MGRPWAAARASSLAGAAGVDEAVEVHQHAGQVVRRLVEVLAAFRAVRVRVRVRVRVNP